MDSKDVFCCEVGKIAHFDSLVEESSYLAFPQYTGRVIILVADRVYATDWCQVSGLNYGRYTLVGKF
jgi:hypothetical protein